MMQAQQVQFASSLGKYSSDLGGKQNGIKRILGIPDAFPQGGSSPNAWSPKNSLSPSESVTVGFDHPQTVKQVAVFENLNAGCLVRIQTDSGDGKFKTLWSRPVSYKTTYAAAMPADRRFYYNRKRRKIQAAPNVSANASVEYAVFDAPVPNVAAVRLEFNFSLLPGEKQIDAIAISDSEAPVTAKINSSPELGALADPDLVDTGNLAVANPMLSADGNTLYLSVYDADKQSIYAAARSGDHWSGFQPADALLSDNDTFNSIEACGENFILKGGVPYRRGTGECGFEFLEKKDGQYYSSGQIRIAGYNNYDDTADATTTDGGKLILALETDFTQGGSDLYLAARKEDGSYGLLENLGKAINSAADEAMPQLLHDNRTLIFSSNGFSGYGDYDLYVTRRLDDSWKKWSAPVNLGGKINGPGFDGSPHYDEKNEILYYIRGSGDGTKLFRIGLPSELLAD
jgi:hypothetical protein